MEVLAYTVIGIIFCTLVAAMTMALGQSRKQRKMIKDNKSWAAKYHHTYLIIILAVALIPSCTSRSGKLARVSYEYNESTFIRADSIVAKDAKNTVFTHNGTIYMKPSTTLRWTDSLGFIVVLKVIRNK